MYHNALDLQFPYVGGFSKPLLGEAVSIYAQSFIAYQEPSIEKHVDVLISMAEAVLDQSVQQRVVPLLLDLRRLQLPRA